MGGGGPPSPPGVGEEEGRGRQGRPEMAREARGLRRQTTGDTAADGGLKDGGVDSGELGGCALGGGSGDGGSGGCLD